MVFKPQPTKKSINTMVFACQEMLFSVLSLKNIKNTMVVHHFRGLQGRPLHVNVRYAKEKGKSYAQRRGAHDRCHRDVQQWWEPQLRGFGIVVILCDLDIETIKILTWVWFGHEEHQNYDQNGPKIRLREHQDGAKMAKLEPIWSQDGTKIAKDAPR